ncbi:MAG: START-like domain-containing protein [Bacteroidota bacterium]
MKRVQIQHEYLFRASPMILYKFFTTPSCLVRWFCDEVDIQDDIFTFVWEGAEEVAELIDDIEEERLKFEWEEGDDDEFFEITFERSQLTGETILQIIEFCDEDEVDDQGILWDSLIKILRQETGG